MSESLIQAARRANRQFKDFMKQSGQAIPLYRSITPEDLKKLSQSLEKVGALLGVEPLPADLDTELKSELGNYVSNLEGLLATLQEIQSGVETRRGELQTEKAHLDSSRAWAESYKSAGS